MGTSRTTTGRAVWAARVKEERARRGWRQADLADRAGVPLHAVRAVEIGRSVPDPVRLAIADVFALPWHVLFNLDDLRVVGDPPALAS